MKALNVQLRVVLPQNISPSRGITLIEVIVVISLILIVLGLSLPAIQNAREASRVLSCRNNLRQLSVACLSFESQYGYLPPGHLGPPLSERGPLTMEQDQWTGHLGYLLPFLEEAAAFQEMPQVLWNSNVRTGPPWFSDGQVGGVLSQLGCAVLKCPSDSTTGMQDTIVGIHLQTVFFAPPGASGLTNYLGCNGVHPQSGNDVGCFYSRSQIRLRDIRDGLSTTLLFGEVTGASEFDTTDRVTAKHSIMCGAIPLDHFVRQPKAIHLGPTYAKMFRSQHLGFVNFSFADGAVGPISEAIDMGILRSLGNRSDGDMVIRPF